QKTVHHRLDALEATAAGRHPVLNLIDDVRRLDAEDALAVPGKDRLVEAADELLVLRHAYRVITGEPTRAKTTPPFTAWPCEPARDPHALTVPWARAQRRSTMRTIAGASQRAGS